MATILFNMEKTSNHRLLVTSNTNIFENQFIYALMKKRQEMD